MILSYIRCYITLPVRTSRARPPMARDTVFYYPFV